VSYQDIWLGQTQMTYANNDALIFGGSLEQGVLDGLFLAVKQAANRQNIVVDKRKLKKHFILLAVIKGDNFMFYGSTKTKLYMPLVRQKIKKFVAEQTAVYFKDNDGLEREILDKFAKDDE
jgi:DNA gyrase/topoisomerase IV subunit B